MSATIRTGTPRTRLAPRRGWFHRFRCSGECCGEHLAQTRWVIPITDAATGTAHLVTDEEMAAGRRAGRYVTVCSVEALAASLTAEADRFCPLCREWARQ